jgi:Protein of unknown function (DUF3300)
MTNKRVPIALRRAGVVSTLLVSAAMLLAQQQPPPVEAQAPAPLLTPDQLDTLVAPIALYPDALLSQILVASTYPLEIVEAGQWLNENRGLRGQQLLDAARQQNWDPSIQALVVFPDVIARLNADIRWTTDVGNAFLAQQADVMAAVQRLRAQAMAAGQLSSNAQETVTTDYQDGQEAIDIAPVNPEVVYVPYYNPVYIWGPPAWGYYPDWDDFGIGIGFGPGIYIGSYFGGIGWGGWGWGCNWFHGFIFNRPSFFSHCGFHGFAGGRAWGGNTIWSHNAYHRLGVAYPNRGLTARYGGLSASRRAWSNIRVGTQPVRASRQNFTARASTAQSRFRPNTTIGGRNSYARGSSYARNSGAAQTGGWRHFNGAPSTAYRASPGFGARSSYAAGSSYARNSGASRYSPSLPGNYSARSFRSSPSYSRSYSAPSYHSSPSFGRNYSAPVYRSSPSYSRGYSAPSYHASPSYGRNYGAPVYRSSPSYSRGYSAPSYHASPSLGRNYGAPVYRSSPSYSRGYSAPSYHASPSYGRSLGGGYSAPRSFGSHFGGGGGFHGGGFHGGGSFHGGGGGSFHGGGSSFHGGRHR